jgi:sugar-specific transcriptional regulator TrmB
MEPRVNQLKYSLTDMGLNEYQASALAYLMYLGETKATDLSKASGVPNARIYGVLEELSQKGLVIVRPGRPALYAPMAPEEIADGLIDDTREEIRERLTVVESHKKKFSSIANEVFLKGGRVKVRTPLIRIVSVGDVSIEETRRLYRGARSDILILTRAMEYLPQVIDELKDAVSRGLRVRVLMRSRGSLKGDDASKRDKTISEMRVLSKDLIEIRVSDVILLRGSIIDPEGGGRALFLVEEEGVPYYLREAAITSHPGVVRGLADMFDLKWRFDSGPPD